MSEYDNLDGYMETVENLSQTIRSMLKREDFRCLPTLLELLYQETQTIIDEFCVKE